MTWVAVAVTVGSAIVGGYEQHQVAKKQDNLLAAQYRQEAATKQQATARTQALISQLQGQTDQPAQTAAKAQYDTALKANQQTAQAPIATVGAVSDAYKKAGSDAVLGIANNANTRADLTASMDAPGITRQNNRPLIDNYTTDVGNLNRDQQSNDFLSSMKINAVHANPWLAMLTQAGGAYAKAKVGANQDPWSEGNGIIDDFGPDD